MSNWPLLDRQLLLWSDVVAVVGIVVVIADADVAAVADVFAVVVGADNVVLAWHCCCCYC